MVGLYSNIIYETRYRNYKIEVCRQSFHDIYLLIDPGYFTLKWVNASEAVSKYVKIRG